jgi:hypothetical protein
MDVLKKIKAATLVETIVASVVIVLVFGLATRLLNNVYKSTLMNDTSHCHYELNKLVYQYKNKAIAFPFRKEFENFEILGERGNTGVIFQIEKNGKIIKKQVIPHHD